MFRVARPWSAIKPHVFHHRLAQQHVGGHGLRNAAAAVRCMSSADEAITPAVVKPFYITTPIFYVNADPHIGHLYSMVVADILKRWQQLKGRRAILCTGTDEHGMKVQKAANAARKDVATFCEEGSTTFKLLATAANISYDHFIRTTDPEHRDAVQYAWSILMDRGHIYMSKHQGWYSISDETYYPESGVEMIVEPSSGEKIMVSKETGKRVEWTEEDNYHFRLSAFKNQLLTHYQLNPDFIQPKSRRMDVIKSVTEGLEDLSVSRPASRLSWGIPVPTDESQTIYVWLDALVNYITTAGFPWAPGAESEGGWPADMQIIGKDIVRFHCVYWPAFLMAMGLPLPKQVLSHAHWTLGQEKMSKSVGNGVNPFFAINRFGTDAVRFYLAHDGGIQNDSAYSNESVVDKYKKGLQNGLGNLASRIVRCKEWTVREAITERKRFKNLRVTEHDKETFATHESLLRHLPQLFEREMDKNDIPAAVKMVMHVVYKSNTFLQAMQPWKLAKMHTRVYRNRDSGGEDTQVKLAMHRIVYQCVEAVRITAILLEPVMPGSAKQLLDMLGVAADKRTFEYSTYGADADYGVSLVDLGSGHVHVAFPPLANED